MASGVGWTLVIANAQWAARRSHTTVIDAAGAIYVLGGRRGRTEDYNDVWVSTDGGADRIGGYSTGTCGYSRGTLWYTGYSMVL